MGDQKKASRAQSFCRMFKDVRGWQIWLHLTSMICGIIALSLVFTHGYFSLFGGEAVFGKSHTMYLELKTYFQPSLVYPDVCEAVPGTTSTESHSSVVAAGAMTSVAACLALILFLLEIAIYRTKFRFSRDEGKPKKRRLCLVFFTILTILVLFVVSGCVIYFGLEHTCNNLQPDGCYMSCCGCEQLICKNGLTLLAPVTDCPDGFQLIKFNTFTKSYDSLVAAANACWAGSAAALLTLIVFVLSEPGATYKACCAGRKKHEKVPEQEDQDNTDKVVEQEDLEAGEVEGKSLLKHDSVAEPYKNAYEDADDNKDVPVEDNVVEAENPFSDGEEAEKEAAKEVAEDGNGDTKDLAVQ